MNPNDFHVEVERPDGTKVTSPASFFAANYNDKISKKVLALQPGKRYVFKDNGQHFTVRRLIK